MHLIFNVLLTYYLQVYCLPVKCTALNEKYGTLMVRVDSKGSLFVVAGSGLFVLCLVKSQTHLFLMQDTA